MAKITVIREVKYEGEESWVRATLEKSLKVGHSVDCGKGTVSIKNHWEYPDLSAPEEDNVQGSEEVPHGS